MHNAKLATTILSVSLLSAGCAPLPPKHEVAYSVPCSVGTETRSKYEYQHVPPKVDTQGQAPASPAPGEMLVGYENEWQQSGIGGVNYRYLGIAYRGFVFFDRNSLPAKGLVLEAKLSFKTPSTVTWQGDSASNETASAAARFYALTAPASGYYSTGDLLVDLPSHPGTTTNAVFDPSAGLVINVTTIIRDIVNGTRPNHGFMLVGANESFQHNNNKFLSTYAAPTLQVRVLEDVPKWPTP